MPHPLAASNSVALPWSSETLPPVIDPARHSNWSYLLFRTARLPNTRTCFRSPAMLHTALPTSPARKAKDGPGPGPLAEILAGERRTALAGTHPRRTDPGLPDCGRGVGVVAAVIFRSSFGQRGGRTGRSPARRVELPFVGTGVHTSEDVELLPLNSGVAFVADPRTAYDGRVAIADNCGAAGPRCHAFDYAVGPVSSSRNPRPQRFRHVRIRCTAGPSIRRTLEALRCWRRAPSQHSHTPTPCLHYSTIPSQRQYARHCIDQLEGQRPAERSVVMALQPGRHMPRERYRSSACFKRC